MKTTFSIYKKGAAAVALGAMMVLGVSSCDDFIEVAPSGVISDVQAYNAPDTLVTAAYAGLGDDWFAYPFNLWPYGDMASDDAFKGGGGTGDTGYHPMEMWSTLTSANPNEMDEMWYRLYCQISRCNRALIALDQNGVKNLGKKLTDQRIAEVKFLRANHYFKLIQLFRKVAWIDEEVVLNQTFEITRNDVLSYEQLMNKVIADFEYAYNNLPTQGVAANARAHKVAAAAYLAKVYLTLAYGDGYEEHNGKDPVNQDYLDKVIQYTNDVVDSPFGYMDDFGDLFLPEYKNNKESIFAVQHSDYKDDHTTFGRANWSNLLNGCYGIWSKGHDFHKPSQNLVNAFKTKDGLPMFDDFDKDHNALVKKGEFKGQKYDPRLFHTVGMPTWPYKYEEQYTLTTLNSRTPSDYGYYTSLKECPQRSKGETFDDPWQAFAMNDYILRYSDIMLMRAEAMVEKNDLSGAEKIVNDIRRRAKKSVDKHIAYASEFCEIEEYPIGSFISKGQEYARQAVRWERRLELAMESNRYFDLRRWGIASKVLNAYFESECKSKYDDQTYATYLEKAHYTPGKNEYWPVPFKQQHYVPDLYTQNKGYEN